MIKKTLYSLLLVAGLAAGPGYWVYDKLYSGESAMTLAMNPSGKDTALGTPPFRLDPGMQPIGLVLHAQGSFVPHTGEDAPPQDGYVARLYKDGSIYQTVKFPLGVKTAANSNPVFNERLLWLGKVPEGQYRLEIQPIDTPIINLDKPRIEVMKNIQEPDGRIVSAAMLMAIIGFLGLFLG